MKYRLDLQIDVDYELKKLEKIMDYALEKADSFSIDLLEKGFAFPNRKNLTDAETEFLESIDALKLSEKESETYQIRSRKIFYQCNRQLISALKNQLLNPNVDTRLSIRFDDMLQDPAFYKEGSQIIFFVVHESMVYFDIDKSDHQFFEINDMRLEPCQG